MYATLPLTPRRWGGHLPFLAFMLLFVASIVGGTAYTLERLRREAIAFHTEINVTQARSFEDQLTQNLNVVDLMLANLLTDATIDQTPAALGAHFQSELRRMPLLRSLSLLDAQHRIVASSNAQNLGRVVETTGYLPQVSGADDDASYLRLGTPWSGRDFADGFLITAQRPEQPDAPHLIPVVRGARVGDRRFTLLAALNPDYSLNLFTRALKGQHATVEVLRLDGTLMLTTEENEHPGEVHLDTALRQAQQDMEFGTYEESGDYEHATLSAFRVSRQFPLVVVTHLDRNLALQAWTSERQRLLWLIAPSLLAVLALFTVLYLRQSRLAQAQAFAQVQERKRLAAVLNALPANLLMLNTQALVVMANAGWFQLLDDARITIADGGIGSPFPELCARICPGNPEMETQFSSGIHRVLNRQDEIFDLEYPIALPGGARWYRMMVHSLHEPGLPGAVVMQIDITTRKETEAALRASEIFAKATIDAVASHICVLDKTGTIVAVNQAWRDFQTQNDPQAAAHNYSIGSNYLQVCDTATGPWSEDATPFANGIRQVASGAQEEFTLEYPCHGPEMQQWFKARVTRFRGDSGNVVIAHANITERKLAELKLQLAANVFTHAREGIMITDGSGTIVDINDTFTRITGYSRQEAIGNNPRMLKSGRQSTEHYVAMWNALIQHGHWYGEVWNRRKSGEIFAEMQTVSAVRDAQGRTQYYVALFSDITSMKEHEQQLERIAHYDALTHLPNRVLLADRLQQALFQSQRRKHSLAVVFLDLDGFKAVNDNHGHDMGDALLIAVAQRLKAAMREGDTLARIGGDEFVAVLVDLEHGDDCVPVLTRMLEAASEPVIVGSTVLRVSASMGATLYPQDGSDADLLMRHADQAMYAAKHSGKNRYHLFDVVQDAAIQTQRDSLERIRLALAQREFVLHYQPKVNIRTGQVIGTEALIRWQHPERGLLMPAEFLHDIENDPISIDVGEWVLNTALTQLGAWQSAGLSLPVSVNLGARQLQQPGFVARLQELLAAHPDVQPSYLELELLETSALEDIEQVSEVMRTCRHLGVRFALDDFGTGYSSLTHLRRLPAEMLKIDQSFVRDMLTSPDDLAIVQGVIGLAAAFHRDVIAEGVESQAHGALLLSLGCELAQGYGIARPMPAPLFQGWISRWHADRAWLA
ncbi:MAG: EAL domain-containing protein [Rhodoferax sp.]